MRLIFLPVLLAASSAVAAEPAKKPAQPEVVAAQRALADPAMANRMARMAGVLTRSLMNLPVGEIEAAAEGRPATPADRRKTVGDSVGGPTETARIEREVAASGAQMHAMGKAMAAALPAMVEAFGKAAEELGKATANLPDPTYPNR